MDKQKSKHPPLSNLKQMSIKRQNLEKSSDELTANLEKLQKVNEEQENRITSTLTQLRKQQQMAQELLQSDELETSPLLKDENNSIDIGRRKVQREPTVIRQLRQWTTADVIRWLENTKLHKFILLFQRHHVSGADLADIKLPFLEDYDHISVEDREILLTEVYQLLRLEHSEENDSSRIKTLAEREKYLAAVHLTKDKDLYQRSVSMPYMIISPQHNNTSRSSPSSDVLSPTPKLRKRSSEPGPDVRWSDTTKMEKDQSRVSKTSGTLQADWTIESRQKNLRINSDGNATLYSALDGKSVQHIYCEQLQKQSSGQFGITVEADSDGDIIISQVYDSDQISNFQPGDRLVEVNGFSVTSDKSETDHLNSVRKIMEESEVLQLVALRKSGTNDGSCGCRELPNNNNLSEEFKWNQLRRLLITMKNQDEDPNDIMNEVPVNELQEMDNSTLQDEIKELKKSIDEQQNKIENLEADLESRERAVEELELQRDRALNMRKRSTDSKRQGETTYYKITMETLNVQSASKDQVVDVLKDIVKEASKQKFYLDRLISVVVDEVPWILEQVDAEFDEMSLGSQSEEFC